MKTLTRENLRCPVCPNGRVVEGKLTSSEMPCRFELPPQQPGFFATHGPRVELDRPGFLCVDCGMVWTQVDKTVAIEEFAHRGNDELLERLHLTARPKRRWRWLLLGDR